MRSAPILKYERQEDHSAGYILEAYSKPELKCTTEWFHQFVLPAALLSQIRLIDMSQTKYNMLYKVNQGGFCQVKTWKIF